MLEAFVRTSLWVTGPLNLLAAAAFAFPASGIGTVLELPVEAHPFYTLFSGSFVGLFGLIYLWLARQTPIVRPLLLAGACGKTMAATISLSLFSAGQLSGLTTTLISGDLAFAALWFYFLSRSPAAPVPGDR